MALILFNRGRLGVDDKRTLLQSLPATSAMEVPGSFVCAGQMDHRDCYYGY